jgi:hypothetical protein
VNALAVFLGRTRRVARNRSHHMSTAHESLAELVDEHLDAADVRQGVM